MTRLFEAKPFIVAEIGSNWTTLPECLASIAAAKRVGADAVKFQLFDDEALYGFSPKNPWNQSTLELLGYKDDSQWGPITSGQLPRYWLPKLKAMADEQGIEFMCTAFSPELVAVVDPFVSVHKVASSDAAWPQMLEAVARTGKPVLVSLGAKANGTLPRIVEIFGSTTRLVPMQCVAAYPADFVDLDAVPYDGGLLGIKMFGFSDHTLGYTATVEAARRGAIVIEKHFTAFPELDTPDRPHSLTPDQFARMVKLIRGETVESEEGAMFLRHNRRLIATHDIPAGQSLRYGVNFGSYRSLVDDARGASPFDWEKVNGRMAKGPITRGVAIALEDVE